MRLQPGSDKLAELPGAEVLGLREITVSSPHGEIRLQYWLAERADGGPHAEFVPGLIWKLSIRQYAWLRAHRAELKATLLAQVEAEWRKRPHRPAPSPGQ